MIVLEPTKIPFETDMVKDQVMVTSHERSGTHFLMNSIALNSVYSNEPFLNFDYKFLGSTINFNEPYSIGKFFDYLHDNDCSSVLKNHFEADFFVNTLGKRLKTVYIYRHPLDVMLSYKRYVDHLYNLGIHWGPRCDTMEEFIFSAPEGSMMRYQWTQSSSLLHRWEKHINSWMYRAHFVSYEELDTNFTETMKGVLEYIGVPIPNEIKRPKDKINDTVFIPGQITLSAEEYRKLNNLIYQQISIDKVRDLCYK